MADIKAPTLENPGSPRHGGTFGNASVLVESITVAAATIGDRFVFAELQPGVKLIDAEIFASDGTTDATLNVGYESTDGSGGDADYFIAAQSIASAGRFRADENNPPALLDEKSYVTATLAGANIASATTLTVRVSYVFEGHE